MANASSSLPVPTADHIFCSIRRHRGRKGKEQESTASLREGETGGEEMGQSRDRKKQGEERV